jgi:hypothetical protein
MGPLAAALKALNSAPETLAAVLRRRLEILETLVAPHLELCLRAMSDLGRHLIDTGVANEGRVLLARATSLMDLFLGPKHPLALACSRHLACDSGDESEDESGDDCGDGDGGRRP